MSKHIDVRFHAPGRGIHHVRVQIPNDLRDRDWGWEAWLDVYPRYYDGSGYVGKKTSSDYCKECNLVICKCPYEAATSDYQPLCHCLGSWIGPHKCGYNAATVPCRVEGQEGVECTECAPPPATNLVHAENCKAHLTLGGVEVWGCVPECPTRMSIQADKEVSTSSLASSAVEHSGSRPVTEPCSTQGLGAISQAKSVFQLPEYTSMAHQLWLEYENENRLGFSSDIDWLAHVLREFKKAITKASQSAEKEELLEAARMVGDEDPVMVYGTHYAIQRLGEELHRLQTRNDSSACTADRHVCRCGSASTLTPPTVCCSVCGKSMEDRGAETQWCSRDCYDRRNVNIRSPNGEKPPESDTEAGRGVPPEKSDSSHASDSPAASTATTDTHPGLYPRWNCPKCGDWFHMPWKNCKCGERARAEHKLHDWYADGKVFRCHACPETMPIEEASPKGDSGRQVTGLDGSHVGESRDGKALEVGVREAQPPAASTARTDTQVDHYQEWAEELTEAWMETLAPLDKVCVASHGELDVMIANALRTAAKESRPDTQGKTVVHPHPEIVHWSKLYIGNEELEALNDVAIEANMLPFEYQTPAMSEALANLKSVRAQLSQHDSSKGDKDAP